ncbi:tyrosine-type recombinase/integrase [Paraperlucidibaca sp.]|uniref:tyrosine-type recombinase/integrase n=1 Tax=Paraperlucidibaca sp. TaxID=2708021 RepID=UPI0030F374F2
MRPRKKDRHLPARVYFKHSSYWYVEKNKWEKLAADLPTALQRYAEIIDTSYRGGMSELIDKVLVQIEPSLKPNTVTQYRIIARRLKPILVEFSPSQVKQRHIAEIKTSMASTPNMANRCLSFLRLVFALAVEWQLCDSNPCIGVRRHQEAKRSRYMTDEEFVAIRTSAAHKAIPTVMDLCYLTGQRIGDVLAIKNTDISETGIQFIQQKTGTKLTVSMTSALLLVIQDARSTHPQIMLPNSPLLYTRGGKPYSYGTIKDAYQRAKTAAQVEGVTIHDIRAKSLTDADQQGHDAQKLGGHSNRKMTERYIRLRRSILVSGPNHRAGNV